VATIHTVVCDRCKAQSEMAPEEVARDVWKRGGMHRVQLEQSTIDLCESCYAQLGEFLKQPDGQARR